jgi:hypothetical protein
MIGSTCGPLFSKPLRGLQVALEDVKQACDLQLCKINDDNHIDNDDDDNDKKLIDIEINDDKNNNERSIDVDIINDIREGTFMTERGRVYKAIPLWKFNLSMCTGNDLVIIKRLFYRWAVLLCF